jgi:hypothetical protein
MKLAPAAVLAAIVLLAAPACSTLPRPAAARATRPADAAAARAILEQSVRTHGDSWRRYRVVEAGYDGTWSRLVPRLQPVLVDAEFRKSSLETYEPRTARVLQVHRGPAGVKEVERRRGDVVVRFNGAATGSREVLDAAALVADAYTMFLFGPSWLLAHATELDLSGERDFAGERCRLVAGVLRPGLGNSREDRIIAWVGASSGVLLRIQFTLNGLASTAGADVDVSFSGHWRAPDGSLWPGRFVEFIQRPVLAKAHDWTLTSLRLDGRPIAVGSVSR